MKRLDKDSLVLGPRPGKKSFDRLSELSLTHVCTLLSEREQVSNIEHISKRLGCDWIWLPMDGGHLETLRGLDIASYVKAFFDGIANTERPHVYLHCSAGIHRTGFFAYLLLRSSGWMADEAADYLATLRPVTAEQVGEDRIALAEEMFVETL